MSGTELKQRLVAILAADAVGYSRLMGIDERATVAALDGARAVFGTGIQAHRGRVIDMAGDSVLAVFDLPSSALSAALEIQRALAEASAELPKARRLAFRIGVHLGEIIEKPDGSVYGDGVNVTARLQALAAPGGITVSGPVRSAVRGKLDAAFDDQGEQAMKNIADPVRVFRVRAPQDAAAPAEAGQDAPGLPDRPSIAVLAFDNMSGDAEQDYFADGMVEDIITELSRFKSILVIARNTTFTYKGKRVDAKAVARDLGVHFLLEGSVRRAGDRVRVTAQLIDGQTGSHVWAERYEDVLSDVFGLQERITRQVVASLVSEIEAEEIRHHDRGERRFTPAEDVAWRAFSANFIGMFEGDPAHLLEGAGLAEQALALDANCHRASYALAMAHTYRVFMGWSEDRAAELETARRAAERVMVQAPADSRSHLLRGYVACVAGEHVAGVADLRRAHELNANDSLTLFLLSMAEAAEGEAERAKSIAAQALRVSPKDRWVGVAYLALAMAAFIERDLDALRRWAELSIQSHPTAPIRRTLMLAYAGEVGDAALRRVHLERLKRVAPNFIASLFRGEYRPFHRPAHMQLLLDGLRKAGLGE